MCIRESMSRLDYFKSTIKSGAAKDTLAVCAMPVAKVIHVFVLWTERALAIDIMNKTFDQ